MVNFGAANSPTTGVGGEHPYIDSSNSGLNDPLLNGLRALGHTVSFAAQSSGVSTIVKTLFLTFAKNCSQNSQKYSNFFRLTRKSTK